MQRVYKYFHGAGSIIMMLGLLTITMVIGGCTMPITVTCAGCGGGDCKGSGEEPGGCLPPKPWQSNTAPPPGAIQVNPIGPLPANAICTAPSNNACVELPGTLCSAGKFCKDTWNKGTGVCMCKCM